MVLSLHLLFCESSVSAKEIRDRKEIKNYCETIASYFHLRLKLCSDKVVVFLMKKQPNPSISLVIEVMVVPHITTKEHMKMWN